MRETIEREIKLVPGEGFVMLDEGEQRPSRAFVTTYVDTDDLRLARRGITLRHRVEGAVGVWQLKLPRGAARLELEAPGSPTSPPAEVTRLLAAHLRGRDLAPVARLRTRRETRAVEGAEIVADTVWVMDGLTVVTRFDELEVELVGGDEDVLDRLRRRLVGAGAIEADHPPKLYRALGLSPPAGDAPRAGPETPPAVALGLALAREVGRLLSHDPGVRRGDDPEDVHQARVAVRRLRAFLRAARPLLDREWADGVRAELRWLGSALGPARDLDVMLEQARVDVRALGEDGAHLSGFVAALEDEWAAAYASAVAALDDARYFALLDVLEGAATPPLSARSEPLAAAWRREVKRLRKTFARLGDDSADDELHAARILVKRARYAAELAEHELGQPGARFVAAAKVLQDVLGEHQDACVYEDRVRQWQAGDAAGSFAAGRLVERARGRRARARAEWPGAWKRLRRRARDVSP